MPADGSIINIPAIFITLLLSVLLIRGTQESTKLNRILVGVKLTAIAIFLLLAIPHVDTMNWEPFMPFDVSGIFGGAAIVFFAYIGFDAVATSAEECKNPSHDLPIGIIGSLVICTALYVVVAGVLTGIVPYTELNNPEPVAFALRYIGYNLGSAVVGVGAIAGITTVLLVLLYGQARIFFAATRDGHSGARLPKILALPHAVHRHRHGRHLRLDHRGLRPHRRHRRDGQHRDALRVPGRGHWASPLSRIVWKPDVPRTFRCPLVWLIAPLAVLTCGYLMYHLPWETWVRFIVWCTPAVSSTSATAHQRNTTPSRIRMTTKNECGENHTVGTLCFDKLYDLV